MFKPGEFEIWHERLGLSEPAVEIIKRIRNSEPFRAVQNRVRNVKGKNLSGKMGCTIQYESHKNELPFIHMLERDDSVHEYYDQPQERVKLEYKAGQNEKVIGIFQTTDFFIIGQNEAGWAECKNEDDLIKLAKESPNRYVWIDGQWRCPPGEAYAEQFGLFYRVISSKEVNWVLDRNFNFLDGYYLEGSIDIPAEVKEKVVSLVNTNPGILLKDLIDMAQTDADNIFRLLVQKEIYGNIDWELLCEPDRFHVYANQQVAISHQTAMKVNKDIPFANCVVDIAPGKEVLWEGNTWTIENIGEKHISLICIEGGNTNIRRDQFDKLVSDGCIKSAENEHLKAITKTKNEILSKASAADHIEASRRNDIIQPYLHGEKKLSESDPDLKETPRTIYNWIKSYLEAERTLGSGYYGLLPDTKRKGNRTPRFSEDVIKAFDEFMDKNETPINQSKIVLYGKFCSEYENKGWILPSHKCFNKWIDERPERLRKTKGNRAAYQEEPFYYEDLPPNIHGDRPFEVGHIDHTLCDVELIDTRTGKNLGRPWLTILFDAFGRRVLAFYITFQSPSKVSDMMVIRECVRRHGKLPDIIVTDNGKDFTSKYFEALLAFCGVGHKCRPPHMGRHGAVLERFFGTVTTQIFHNLSGNTKMMFNVREVTKSINPKNWAVWTLPLLYDLLTEYFYEFYDTREHSSLGESPRELFKRCERYSGNRPFRKIPYNDNFLIMSMPLIGQNDGMAMVDSVAGVRVNYLYYNSPELKGLGKQQVDVRYDPWNAGVVYCYAHNRWVPCYSEYYSVLKDRSTEEMLIASAEVQKRKQNFAKNAKTFARALAEFLMQAEQTEKMQKQRIYDEEIKHEFKVINGGKSDPIMTRPEHVFQNYAEPEVGPFDGDTTAVNFNIDDEDWAPVGGN